MTKEPNVSCAYCAKPFYNTPSHIARVKSGIFFCTIEHKNLAARKNSGVNFNHGPKTENEEYQLRIAKRDYLVQHICLECGNDFESHKIKDDFCKYDCFLNRQRRIIRESGEKECIKCKLIKPLAEFNQVSTTITGFKGSCKKCDADKYAQWVKDKGLNNRLYASNKIRKQENLKLLYEYMQDKKCTDCPITDYRLLVFDHVRGTKITGVGALVARGVRWEAVLEEIAKCEIRCHNCHYLVTGERANYWWTKFPLPVR